MPYPSLDAFLFRPVAEGLWQHHQAIDGTYSFQDLLDAHELLDIRSRNERGYERWRRDRDAAAEAS